MVQIKEPHASSSLHIVRKDVKGRRNGEATPLTEEKRTTNDYYDEQVVINIEDEAPHLPTPPPWDSLYPWTKYTELLEKKPLLVKSITATIILSSADLLAQAFEHARGRASTAAIDWPRAARFGCFGLFGAPWSHYYFDFLDHYLPPTEDPCTRVTALKVFIDQFIQAPILLAFMICALSLMQGEGFHGMKADMQNSYVESLIANWKLWLPASMINIALVKPHLRVLYVNVVFFAWIVILSLLLHSKN